MADLKLVRRDDFTSLRDRIAAAACDATAFGKNFPYATLSDSDREAWRIVADAVIAELGLFREFTWEGSTKLSRVVSKWVADE